jgi:hypothetical protein
LLFWLAVCPLLSREAVAGQPEATVVAAVGDHVITAQAFQAEMARRGLRGSRGGLREKEALLEEMIRLQVYAAKARAAGYDKAPEIVAAVDRMLAEMYQREQAAAHAVVTPDEVAAYYREHGAEFDAVERRQAAIVFVAIPREAGDKQKKEASERAARVAAEAAKLDAKVRSFGPLAAKWSDDAATRYVGGDIGWLQKGEKYRFDAAVVDAVFKLARAGEVSPVLATPGGLYVVRLIEKSEGTPRPLSAVKANIANRLAQEKRTRLAREGYERLKADVPVRIDRAVLEAIVPPPGGGDGEADATPPALPQ